jgi:Rieske Fe-S protein
MSRVLTFNPQRRRVLKVALCAGLSAAIPPIAADASDDPASERPQADDLLIRDGDATLTPLRPDDLTVGSPQVTGWSLIPATKTVRNGSRLNRVLLIRLDESRLAPATRELAAAGVVAYTAICTHNGCEVIEWDESAGALSCPCHGAMYDPKDGGRVVDGPAPRSLPALPLKLVDGRLCVARTFTTPVGFEKS